MSSLKSNVQSRVQSGHYRFPLILVKLRHPEPVCHVCRQEDGRQAK